MRVTEKLKTVFKAVLRRRTAVAFLGIAGIFGHASRKSDADCAPLVSAEVPAVTPFSKLAELSPGRAWDGRPVLTLDMTRAQYRAYAEKYCTPALATPELAEALAVISENAPVTGKAAMEILGTKNLRACVTPHMEKTVTAIAFGGDVIALRPAGRHEMAEYLVHELMHIQQASLRISSSAGAHIEERMPAVLAREAAAFTLALGVAFEKHVLGDSDMWKKIEREGKSYASPGMLDSMTTVYVSRLLARGDHGEAVRDAMKIAYAGVMESRSLAASYLRIEMAHEARRIVAGYYDRKAGSRIKGPDLSATRKYLTELTRVQEKNAVFAFIGAARPPSLADVVAADAEMRQAYEALLIDKETRRLGAGNKDVQKLRRAAEAGGNPYIGLNLKDVLAVYDKANAHPDRFFRRHMTIVAAMDAVREQNRLRAAEIAACVEAKKVSGRPAVF